MFPGLQTAVRAGSGRERQDPGPEGGMAWAPWSGPVGPTHIYRVGLDLVHGGLSKGCVGPAGPGRRAPLQSAGWSQ